MINSEDVISETQRWFDRVVLGLNLCPFAHVPAKEGRVRFCVLRGDSESALVDFVEQELERLRAKDKKELETTVIAAPEGFVDFFYYMVVVEYLESWLARNGWEGEVQIASFHPAYQFADTDPDDLQNLTNRAPYPLFHLIRESSLTEIIDNGADTEAIPARNIERIKALSQEERLALFPAV